MKFEDSPADQPTEAQIRAELDSMKDVIADSLADAIIAAVEEGGLTLAEAVETLPKFSSGNDHEPET